MRWLTQDQVPQRPCWNTSAPSAAVSAAALWSRETRIHPVPPQFEQIMMGALYRKPPQKAAQPAAATKR